MIVGFLYKLFAFIVVLAPLVFIHELGHFLAAKMFRISVPVFSIGFGPRLFGFRRAETDYRVSLVPLGGYVRMSGDEADQNRSGAPNEFLSKARWQRLIVFVAGPLFNIVLALLGLWIYFGVYGKVEGPKANPTILAVEENSGVERAGLLPGDIILSIDGEGVQTRNSYYDTVVLKIRVSPNTTVPIVFSRDGERNEVGLETGQDPSDGSGLPPGWYLTWQGDHPAVVDGVLDDMPAKEAGLLQGDRIVAAGEIEPINQAQLQVLLYHAAGVAVPMRIQRGEESIELSITPRLNDGVGQIGISFRGLTRRTELSFAAAAIESYRENLKLSKTLFVVLRKLFTAQLPLKTMSGPIGIAQYASQAMSLGFDALLYLLCFFSLQLGILNLLPIPVLDGGHILLLGIESVMGRELSETVKERVMQAGLVFLLTFMAVIVFLDFTKIF